MTANELNRNDASNLPSAPISSIADGRARREQWSNLDRCRSKHQSDPERALHAINEKLTMSTPANDDDSNRFVQIANGIRTLLKMVQNPYLPRKDEVLGICGKLLTDLEDAGMIQPKFPAPVLPPSPPLVLSGPLSTPPKSTQPTFAASYGQGTISVLVLDYRI